MTGNQEQFEIKFRLTDGSDIGPKSFPAATSIATLKESILAQWPKETLCSCIKRDTCHRGLAQVVGAQGV
ncbi:membrane-anchored ubiquitin-fold protein [Trifolium medium]|uniref:Membrane-anchored ubiquitin-fold protein n=1 Tax=Trifolium medium TaxID=97028 RepID=A0A392QRJ7_9FABA|nr:membrane-anchored ubiquitin-fold protein [Trifolium medium]